MARDNPAYRTHHPIHTAHAFYEALCIPFVPLYSCAGFFARTTATDEIAGRARLCRGRPKAKQPVGMARLLLVVLSAGAAMAQGTMAQSLRPTADVPVRTVFIGGTYGLTKLIPPSNVAKMLATGRIGLYEHGVGMSQLSASEVRALLTTWAPSGTKATGGGGGIAETAEAPVGTLMQAPDYLRVFGASSVYPGEVTMNTGPGSGGGNGLWTAGLAAAKPGHVYKGYYTAADLDLFASAVQEAKAHGARTVAPFVSPNDPAQNLDDAFDTDDYWAPVRAMARQGGGLALDVPPNYAFARESAYLAMIAQMIRFCQKSGLRSILVVSPWALVPDASGHTGNLGFDTELLNGTKRLVGFLKAHQAFPSQWVVENYSAPAQGGTENAPGADNEPGTLNEVALYLARAIP
jgi:hypothetical protein